MKEMSGVSRAQVVGIRHPLWRIFSWCWTLVPDLVSLPGAGAILNFVDGCVEFFCCCPLWEDFAFVMSDDHCPKVKGLVSLSGGAWLEEMIICEVEGDLIVERLPQACFWWLWGWSGKLRQFSASSITRVHC